MASPTVRKVKLTEATMTGGLQEKKISSQHWPTYYWVSETQSDITLVFLPGLTADHTLFESQISCFQDDFRIIVWDCPGHGKSRPYDEFTYENVTTELHSILTAENVDTAVFIGQSLGGMIAQFYIDRYPEKAAGFVSVDSVPFGDYYSRSDMFWLSQLERMCRMFPDKTLRSSMARMCGATRSARNRMMQILSVYTKKELCHLMYIGEAAFIPENKCIELPCPGILLLGEKDRVGKVASYTKAWAKRTGYPIIKIPGAAHNSNDDRPELVNQIISDFLVKIYESTQMKITANNETTT